VPTPQLTRVRIGLHEVGDLRWPKQPVAGEGKRQDVAVPLPRLPWATTSVTVPLGASAVEDIARITRLRRIFGYVVAPVIILLFVVADVLLLVGRSSGYNPPGSLFLIFGVVGVVLILTGLLPDQVARMTGTPYVARGQLRLPRAHADAVDQLEKLNPDATIVRS
jgi:hypothetical protein